MITIQELEKAGMDESLGIKLKQACLDSISEMSKGVSLAKVFRKIEPLLPCYMAVKHYEVNGYTPSSYFNMINPRDVFGIYSIGNTRNSFMATDNVPRPPVDEDVVVVGIELKSFK